MPVIIGSYAAALGGFLPEWRRGRTGDIDILCTANELDQLRQAFHRKFDHHAPGRAFASFAGHRLDVEIVDDLHIFQRHSTFETVTIGIVDIEAHIALRPLIWATRVFTVHKNPAKSAAALLDLAHYAAGLGDVPQELLSLAAARGVGETPVNCRRRTTQKGNNHVQYH